MSAGITLADATAALAAWVAADLAVSRNQSYSIDADGVRRQLTRADAAVISSKITFWQSQVERLSAGSSASRRQRYIVPE